MNIDAIVARHFPDGALQPDLADLVFGNERFVESGKVFFEPQKPKAVVFNCGKLSAEAAHDVQEHGHIFDASLRGVLPYRAALASIEYAFLHLGEPKPAVLEVLVHDCVKNGACRLPLTQGGLDEELFFPRTGADANRWREGLKVIEMAEAANIPEHDRVHAAATSRRILDYSEGLRELVAQGKVLVAEGYYDNDSGKIRYTRFLTSDNPETAPPMSAIIAASQGRATGSRADLHPSIQELLALVYGNDAHVENFSPPVPTEFVVFGCADSRTSPYLIFNAEHGQLEVLRNAGNVVNQSVLRGIRIAVEDALAQRERVNLIVLTHSRCGAVNAVLSPHEDAKPGDHGNDGALPILENIDHRFDSYRVLHPDFKKSDPVLSEASRANAIGAAMDILSASGPDADFLQRMLADGRLVIVPARYRLQSGVVEFFRPIKPDVEARPGFGPRAY